MTKTEMQAMDAVIGVHRETKEASEPGWEQQQYEVAKEIFLHRVKTPLNSVRDDAESAVGWADLFIFEPKKEK